MPASPILPGLVLPPDLPSLEVRRGLLGCIGECQGGRLADYRAQAGDERFHEGDGLLAARPQGAGTEPVVHEDDRARTEKGLRTAHHLTGGVTPPIAGVGASGGEAEPEVLRDLLRPGGEDAPGRAPETGFYVETP